MPLIAQRYDIPEPGRFLRYWSERDKRFNYVQLLDQEGPMRYPIRLSSLAAGARSSNVKILRDLNPSAQNKHRYLAFLGVSAGFSWRLFHPYDTQRLMFDARPVDVDIDTEGDLQYQDSPIDAPTKSIWIEPDRFPGVDALNLQDVTSVPMAIWVVWKYLVQVQGEMDPLTIQNLETGRIPSSPVNFGAKV